MADIVLKDRNGKDVTYEGIETVTFDTTAEGVQATFTEGVAVEDLEIVPDFSGGDMPVMVAENTLAKSAIIKKPEDLTPENIRKGKEIGGVSGNFIGDTEEVVVGESEGASPLNFAEEDSQIVTPSADGKVISRVTIEKPANLLPENIAEGVDIAGIIGTLAAGGGGSALIASGKVTTTAGPQTINHNLGVVPDIVILTTGAWDSTYPRVRNVLGIGSAFAALCGYNFCFYTYETSSSADVTVSNINANSAIDTATSGPGIFNATTTQFSIGSSSFKVNSGSQWIAIGGLT